MTKFRFHSAKISAQWFDDDVVGGLPPATRLLLLGLYCMADRSGTVGATPEEIQKRILKYATATPHEVEQLLKQLCGSGLLLDESSGTMPRFQITSIARRQFTKGYLQGKMESNEKKHK